MSTNGGATWQAKAMSAVVVLLVVAAGARLAWELLRPLVPVLLVVLVLGVVYAAVFGKFRQ